jgi:hypothetical protein
MQQQIIYYIPVEGKKNKAGTAILTIDWFKKRFRLPLKDDCFTELSTYDACFDVIPQIGWTISIENRVEQIQGKVESIIYQKTEDIEYIRVLLRPY